MSIFAFFHSTHDLHQLKKACSQQRSNAASSIRPSGRWLKQNRKADSWFYGMGFWTRSNAEVCLLATRGRPKRQCAGIHQFVISHIEQHSKKPDEVRDKIVKLMGDQPRVELFARQKTPGWDVWGNEVNCTLTMPERKG